MSIDYNALAIPKGRTRKQLKAKKDREDAERLAQFRDRIWLREQDKFCGDGTLVLDGTAARCQHCGLIVVRGPSKVLTGEVHHRISRRHKATRYDPDNGVLLCNHLVNNCHQLAELGRITV